MDKPSTNKTSAPASSKRKLARAVACLSLAATSVAVDASSDADVAGFVENATFYRESKGISKFRNTAQLEFSKALDGAFNSSSFSVNGTFRATYDGVYDLNDDEWGDSAGRRIDIEDGPMGGTVGHGEGVGSPSQPAFPTLGFADANGNHFNQMYGLRNYVGNPNANEGLILLGEPLANVPGQVQIGVPVRPCDVDPRGCTALEDYMDKDEDELKWSDFNDHWDFIRELYVVSSWDLDNGHQVGMKLGKQQVVWGRTDLFRVLDVLNPVDYSRNNIYDELEDIRIPQWMMELEYRWGPIGSFDDLNLSFVWNFDEFRPANLGQAGTPYQILQAGDFFRAMGNCWLQRILARV